MSALGKFQFNKRLVLSCANETFCTQAGLYSNGQTLYNDDNAYQSIADAYAGKSLFFTGGTGFLGKVMIERLLYNCNDIKNIYVLIRQKKGVSMEQRLEEMFRLPVYKKLKDVRPGALDKVIPIQGDLAEPELGIKLSDQAVLQDKVSMVFHLGASVLFRDSLKNLMNINCGGTRRVMDLSKKIKNLEAFVYFSTAFSSLHRRVLDEVMYPPIVSPQIMNECMETDDKKKLKKYADVPPYTISKSLAETIVYEERGDLPTIMIRPSAVIATLRDPIGGWLDSWISMPSFFLDHSRGLVSVAMGYKDVVCDVIPCDYVCNLAIAAAARGNKSKDMVIYNCCTSSTSPLTWKEACDMFRTETKKIGKWELPPRNIIFVSSPAVVYILTIIRDRIPAILGDLYLRIRRENPRFVKLQNRSLYVRDSIALIIATSLFMKTSKAQALSQTLDKEDQARFPFDTNTINWAEYMPMLQRSIFKYLLNKKK